MDQEDGLGHAHRSPVKFMEPPTQTNMARELWEAFKRHSDRVLLVDTASGRQWTGAKLGDYCARLSSGLIKQINLKPGDIVMTICDHNDQEIVASLGVVLAGGALFGTQPSDGYEEARTLCEIVRPSVLVINSKHYKMATMLRHQVTGLSGAKIISLDDDELAAIRQEPQVYLVEELISAKEAPDLELVESIIYQQIKPSEHMLSYMLTSGSTGRPKVVPSTHEELVYGLYSMISAATTTTKQAIDANNNELTQASLLPHGPNEIVSGDLPLDHGAGLNTMFLSLWMGAKFIVMPSYNVDAFWQAVNDYQISFSISSTTFCYKLFARLKQLIDAGETGKKWPRLESFKYIACCGAKLAFLELIREVQQHFKHIQVTQAYGCTEIGFISIVHLNDCYTHLHSVGTLFPGIRAKVVDFDSTGKPLGDQLLGPEKRGELLIWSRSKFKGYRCQPEDDAALIYANCHDPQGKFYRTGDQAHLDAEGRVYVHGRFKDTLYLMEDWKILPSELEEIINEHPLVEMSAVVGVADPNLPGCHAPRAYVKLLEGGRHHLNGDHKELTANSCDMAFVARHIYEFVAARTARPKHLTGGVRVLDEFPRVGLLNKIDRKALKVME